MYVVIMAGGRGTRLWPMSREQRPKQFQALVTEQSLLQETYERVRRIAEPHEIYVSTTEDLAHLCGEQLDELPEGNVLVEPVGRNTGPAIGLVAAWFERLDPEAVVATVASDHAMGRPELFADALRLAEQTIADEPDTLMTIGLQPTWGDPGFGYIKANLPDDIDDPELEVLKVEEFKEKPSPEVAEQYVQEGGYYWNASYFVFRAGTMMDCLKRYDPSLHNGLKTIQAAIGGDRAEETLQSTYREFASVPIDTLVFEPESREGRVRVIPASLEWDDLGNWKTLRDKMCEWSGEEVVTRGEVITVGSRRCLVYGAPERLVALVGLEDVVVVDTPDAVLICHADQAQDVKEVLAALDKSDVRR